jgi:hypothetical protein
VASSIRISGRLGLIVTSLFAASAFAWACSDDPATGGGGGSDAGANVDGSSGAPGEGGGGEGGPPAGEPIKAVPGAWSFVDFPDAVCDDGSPTGLGINPSPSGSTNLVVFFNGGGACWDYGTCVSFNTSTHGPFGATQFIPIGNGLKTGTLFDRDAAANPFKDWNQVFVPYCTGDIHAGDAVQTYTSGSSSKVIHHKGRANVAAYLKRLYATFKSPGKIAVTGSSAGGGGALFNYPAFRAYWPTTPMYLVDDSLPMLEGNSIVGTLRDAWYTSWNLAPYADPLCPGCKDDLSLLMKTLSQKWPKDRMALLSSQQDKTIRTYFQLQPAAFQTALEALDKDVLDPTPNFRHFIVTGETHTMLGAPANFTAGTTALPAWLGQMINDDAAWNSVGP